MPRKTAAFSIPDMFDVDLFHKDVKDYQKRYELNGVDMSILLNCTPQAYAKFSGQKIVSAAMILAIAFTFYFDLQKYSKLEVHDV